MNRAIQSFYHKRFGIFFHWGIYSELGGRWKGESMPHIGEWAQSYFKIPNREYEEVARNFNPVNFNADEWIRRIAAAGAKYIVYTTKHHDGFAMYQSKVDPYNITDFSKFGRDPLKELAEACAKYGVALGIYYSHNLDWHNIDARDPGPDFPENCYCMPWGNNWDYPDHKAKNFERYFRNKCIPQLQELLTEYGPICELWFDCAIGMSMDESRELYDLVHSLQPDCMINSRIGNDLGDFVSLGDNQNMQGKSSVPIESPITLNDTWGYKYDDNNWKSADYLAERMAALADRNANLLLNIGPMGDGSYPEETNKVLDELTTWQQKYPDVISGTTANPFPIQFPWGYCTQSGRKLNFFLTKDCKYLEIPGISGEVVDASCPYQQNDYLYLYPDAGNQDLLQVVTVVFAEEPVIDQHIILNEAGIELSPSAGNIILGDKEAFCDTSLKVDIAAEIITQSSHIKIERDGTASGWHNPSDQIEWSIQVSKPGYYQVEVATCQPGHNAPWTGERTIELLWMPNQVSLTCELKDPRKITSPCYDAGAVSAGGLKLNQAESGKLICRTTSVSNNSNALSMNLMKVILTHVEQDQVI